jgi:hypothetical protein
MCAYLETEDSRKARLPSSAGAEIGPEENSEAAGPIFNTIWVQRYDRRLDRNATHAPSRAFFFWACVNNKALHPTELVFLQLKNAAVAAPLLSPLPVRFL